MCPAAASGPGAGLSAGLLEGKPGLEPPRGKGNAARQAHPRGSASISPHLWDVNKRRPQSETFRAPAVALGLCPLPVSASRGQVWSRASGGDPRPQPLRLCNRPGRGCSASAPRPAAEARPRDPAAGAEPGAVGGWGGQSSRPPGPPPGGQESRGADIARRGRPRGGPMPRRGREGSAARPALPAHRAGTAGGGSGCRDGGRRAAALAATRPRHVRNRGGGCGGGGGRGTDSPRPRLQAPGPRPLRGRAPGPAPSAHSRGQAGSTNREGGGARFRLA